MAEGEGRGAGQETYSSREQSEARCGDLPASLGLGPLAPCRPGLEGAIRAPGWRPGRGPCAQPPRRKAAEPSVMTRRPRARHQVTRPNPTRPIPTPPQHGCAASRVPGQDPAPWSHTFQTPRLPSPHMPCVHRSPLYSPALRRSIPNRTLPGLGRLLGAVDCSRPRPGKMKAHQARSERTRRTLATQSSRTWLPHRRARRHRARLGPAAGDKVPPAESKSTRRPAGPAAHSGCWLEEGSRNKAVRSGIRHMKQHEGHA